MEFNINIWINYRQRILEIGDFFKSCALDKIYIPDGKRNELEQEQLRLIKKSDKYLEVHRAK